VAIALWHSMWFREKERARGGMERILNQNFGVFTSLSTPLSFVLLTATRVINFITVFHKKIDLSHGWQWLVGMDDVPFSSLEVFTQPSCRLSGTKYGCIIKDGESLSALFLTQFP
jgi:hypothetical protein